ncbi:MAG: GAF and ANTAR domain-containing protein [Aeromicrobium erythreum]
MATHDDDRVSSETILKIHESESSTQTVERLVEFVRAAVGADAAGVLMHHSRKDTATSSTDRRVDEAQRLQVDLDEGPCLEALKAPDDDVIWVRDLREDERWPRWRPQALELGYRSVLSVALATRSRRFGSLNVYAERPDAFDVDDRAVAVLLARHASTSLASAIDRESLERAVEARSLIGTAVGFIMATYDVSGDAAFSVLRRYSQDHNVKLRDVAQLVVDTGKLPSDDAASG